VLTLFVILLAILVNYMARPTTRTRALQYLMRGGDYGWLSPLLWAAAIFFFTTVIFSAVTQLLWEWRVVDISDPSCTTPCALIPDNFFNFYTWHFLESIPLFKVNETLQLKEPLVYRGAAAGWLVVAFKVAVILPLIQAIRSYWSRSDGHRANLQSATYSTSTSRNQVSVNGKPKPPPPMKICRESRRRPTCLSARDGSFG